MMRQTLDTITIRTRGRGFAEITREVQSHVQRAAVTTGLCTLHLQHTSASLLIQENADPDVRTDLAAYFETIAPEDPARYVHRAEGPDDMPAHLRAALTQTTLTIPVAEGRLTLGTWQALYLFEHRRAPHERELVLHVLGE